MAAVSSDVQVRMIQVPRKFPVARPVGCVSEPQSKLWEDTAAVISNNDTIDGKWDACITAAELEWVR
eukprot:3948352-Pyramimonas_sp.AAC.1